MEEQGLRLKIGQGDLEEGFDFCYAELPADEVVLPWNPSEPLVGPDENPLDDESVEHIFCERVLQQVPHSRHEWRWFAMWEEFWRVLQVGGVVQTMTAYGASPWVWCDPGNCRVITPQSLHFLDAQFYLLCEQSLVPYRPRCNFENTPEQQRTYCSAAPAVGPPDPQYPHDTLLMAAVKMELPEGYDPPLHNERKGKGG